MITEVSPILSLLFAKGLGTKTLSKLVDRIVREDVPLEDIVGMPPGDFVKQFGLRPAVAEAIGAAHDRAERTAEELDRHGVQILIRGIEPYPNHLVDVLRENAPPIMFARGDLSILAKKAVGFCGARSASEKGIGVAAKSALQLADNDVNVVSGYAKGVDLAAHRAAMEAGGVTTIVLAEGILHFRAKREVAALFEEHNHVVVSEFSPQLPWSGRGAMQRNKTICGLSDAVVCIESGMRGGTFAAAEATLSLNLPLFVAEYAQPADSAAGNRYFIERGATPLRGDRSGKPNLQRVYAAIGLQTSIDSTEKLGRATSAPPVEKTAAPPHKEEPIPEGRRQPTNDASDRYPKRLIEVDLPIARISAHARREKSIRHGHISTLHIWWARRPLAACRAVICAALWPDPASEGCPGAFVEAARTAMANWAHNYAAKASAESLPRLVRIQKDTAVLEDRLELRHALLDFIADFANWDNSTSQPYLETARKLTDAAHVALGGEPGTRPLVVDPFAGGGSIPLEALRVGADAFASDLNPVAVLLNKVVLEYIPKYGQRLADEVRKWGQWVKEQAEKELAEFYPKDPDGATPIAYLWARTIQCEGPDCGAEVPLMRSLWLAKKNSNAHALRIVPNPKEKRVDFEIVKNPKTTNIGDGTVARGSATCPCCGYTTPVTSVRKQLKRRRGGAADARLFCVVTTHPGERGRFYRLPDDRDLEAAQKAAEELERRKAEHQGELSLVPDEPLPPIGVLGFRVQRYGMEQWGDLFTPRQALALTTLVRLVREAGKQLTREHENGFAEAVQAGLAMAIDRQADHGNAGCTWNPSGPKVQHLFTRQAIPMTWDFAEAGPFADSVGDWMHAIDCVLIALNNASHFATVGQVEQLNATNHCLPDDIAACFVTDPPYYDAVPYSDLSDFVYVWLKRTLPSELSSVVSAHLTPKDDECIVDEAKGKDRTYFEKSMTQAMAEGRRVTSPPGIGTVVFAHKSTGGWESMLQAMLDGGWTVTGSWPIDTEMATRLRARESAVLASSVHLVCRPRENPDGSLREETGEWRDVLAELPGRIHEWMPRLAAEGVVGADAIFACLGPALEIFSRYSRVEKASGEPAELREYLEHVWAAVSTEALSMIFQDADAAGLEPDARLTAMWLWTLGAGNGKSNGNGGPHPDPLQEGEGTVAKGTGYVLEFDAARKIAQGLGIHLEKNDSIVEVRGDKARLLPVSERTAHLFGKGTDAVPSGRRKKKVVQKTLFDELDEAEAAEAGWGESSLKGPPPGSTVLDRLHQAMILFAAGRGELLKRFLTEEGVGHDGRFWKLARSLSALYPRGSEENRWVDGVLGRKKGLQL